MLRRSNFYTLTLMVICVTGFAEDVAGQSPILIQKEEIGQSYHQDGKEIPLHLLSTVMLSNEACSKRAQQAYNRRLWNRSLIVVGLASIVLPYGLAALAQPNPAGDVYPFNKVGLAMHGIGVGFIVFAIPMEWDSRKFARQAIKRYNAEL